MKTSEFLLPAAISRAKPVWFLALLLLASAIGCLNENDEPTVVPTPPALTCPDCELVDVAGVIDANTLSTSIGHIKMYGVFVLNEPADCATQAKEQLARLAG
jgi:hypothetical protein